LEKNAKETSNEVRRGKKEVSKDKELELLRRQRMARLMNRLQTRKTEEGRKAEDPKKS
jgi:hypothetical protein